MFYSSFPLRKSWWVVVFPAKPLARLQHTMEDVRLCQVPVGIWTIAEAEERGEDNLGTNDAVAW